MPLLDAPLFSAAANGTLGGVLTYYTRNGVPVLRWNRRRTAPPSLFQLDQQALVREIARAWKTLTDPERVAWQDYAAPYNLTGYNEFWREYVNQGVTAPDLPELP